MRIHAITVSVDYADRLGQTLPLWRGGMASHTIITSPADSESRALAREYQCELVITEAFKKHGATFNKGAAINEALERIPWGEWILFVDADVMPVLPWKIAVQQARPGKIYGAYRELDDGSVMHEPEIAGFFQLWHTTDPILPAGRRLIDETWRHAGGYDSVFQARWHRADRVKLPLMLRHLGDAGRNWFGRDQVEQMDELRERRKGGDRQWERISDYQKPI